MPEVSAVSVLPTWTVPLMVGAPVAGVFGSGVGPGVGSGVGSGMGSGVGSV